MTDQDQAPPSPLRGGGRGRGAKAWAPRLEETRQKDHSRTHERAVRLRRETTPSEKKLWKLLRDEPHAHFRRQIAVDDYVFDFGDYSARLLIELDGAIHRLSDVALRDAAKEAHAVRHGFAVLRFANADVWARPDWVLDQVRARLVAPHPPPPPRKGEGE